MYIVFKKNTTKTFTIDEICIEIIFKAKTCSWQKKDNKEKHVTTNNKKPSLDIEIIKPFTYDGYLEQALNMISSDVVKVHLCNNYFFLQVVNINYYFYFRIEALLFCFTAFVKRKVLTHPEIDFPIRVYLAVL